VSWVILIGVMAVGVPLATNNYAAYWATRNMAVLFFCICLPMQALITSVRRVRWWIYTFLIATTYVGVVAATSQGKAGGLDENYIAALMDVAVAFAYFAIFAEKNYIVKGMLALSMVVDVAAMAMALDPSRGGFLGLCAVGLYCLGRSPRKVLGFGMLAGVGVALLAIAGPKFWSEIDTTTDYQSGTGDIRLEIWKDGLLMLEAHPIVGVGGGNFRWVIGDYQTAEQFAKYGRSFGGAIVAHSLPVELASELGLVGLFAAVVLVVRTWKGLGKVRALTIPKPGRPAPDWSLVQLRCYTDAVRGGLVATLVCGLFLSLTYYSQLWLLLALGSALPFVYRKTAGQHEGAESRPARVSTSLTGRPRAPERLPRLAPRRSSPGL